MEYAVILMQPEYRTLIDPRYKRKIETLVRKSAGLSNSDGGLVEQQLTDTSPCPFCLTQVVKREMTCVSCKNQIPFCLASGYHITRDELTFCPRCDFPALLPHLKKIVTTSVTYDLPSDSTLVDPSNALTCPMCSMSVSPGELILAPKEKIDSFFNLSKST